MAATWPLVLHWHVAVQTAVNAIMVVILSETESKILCGQYSRATRVNKFRHGNKDVNEGDKEGLHLRTTVRRSFTSDKTDISDGHER